MEPVEEYISKFPEQIQAIMQRIRETIKRNAPDVTEECISYKMPVYKLNGKPLVYFAAYAKHIGFYATPTGHSAFVKDLAPYKQGKGSVRFPLDQPIPFKLIERIVRFRVEEVLKK